MKSRIKKKFEEVDYQDFLHRLFRGSLSSIFHNWDLFKMKDLTTEINCKRKYNYHKLTISWKSRK